MIRALGACNDDLSAAIRYYGERYSNRRVPNRRTIQRMERSLLERESFAPFHRNCNRICRRRLIENNWKILTILELGITVLSV